MFKKLIMLAATTSFIALAAPQTAALAQGVPPGLTETLEEFKERCRFEDAARGWGEGMRDFDQASVESRQANDYRQLEENARNNAKEASSKADQDMWNADADRYADNARKLEEEARRNLERGKAAFAKFRAHPGCTEQFKSFMDQVIFGGELRTDPWFYDDSRPMKDETRAMIEQRDAAEAEAEKAEPKADPAPSQEKKKSTKKPAKAEKTKKLAHIRKSKKAKHDVAQSIARDVAVSVASQLILGEISGMGHKHKKHKKHHKLERRQMMDGMAMEEIQPRRKMKMKKLMGAGFGMF
jgi:hypothetical protein